MDQGESQVFPYDKPRIETSPRFLNNDDDDDSIFLIGKYKLFNIKENTSTLNIFSSWTKHKRFHDPWAFMYP